MKESTQVADIAMVDIIEMAIGDGSEINFEVADYPSLWESMIDPIIRYGKPIRNNREFADDVPSPRAAELFARANKEREAIIPRPLYYGDYLLQKRSKKEKRKEERRGNRAYRRMVNNLFREMDRIDPIPRNTRHLSCYALN